VQVLLVSFAVLLVVLLLLNRLIYLLHRRPYSQLRLLQYHRLQFRQWEQQILRRRR
jgi:hypothetical protein